MIDLCLFLTGFMFCQVLHAESNTPDFGVTLLGFVAMLLLTIVVRSYYDCCNRGK